MMPRDEMERHLLRNWHAYKRAISRVHRRRIHWGIEPAASRYWQAVELRNRLQARVIYWSERIPGGRDVLIREGAY